MSTDETQLRASDAERSQAQTDLNRHLAEGRISQAEHDRRSARAASAVTQGDLREALADLPTLGTRADAAARASRIKLARDYAFWAIASVFFVLIWYYTTGKHHHGYFWPAWVIGTWFVALGIQAIRVMLNPETAYRWGQPKTGG